MRIIPAIDLIEGKCVRLTQGKYEEKKIYNENPLEVAQSFEDHGIQHLHLVDLDGAKEGRIVNYQIIEEIASRTRLKIDFGGGLHSDEDLRIAFESGVHQVTGGSIAVKNPNQFLSWVEEFGAAKIILGADSLNGKIATDAWQNISEESTIDFIEKFVNQSLKYTICTDISKDGMLKGPALELYREILSRVKVNLIASGGIASKEDVIKVKEIGCEGVIIGKAIYENRIRLKDLRGLIDQTQ